jgi:SprT-like domain-contaning protein Spartan
MPDLAGPDLYQSYCDLNQQFFAGTLPAVQVRWSTRMTRAAGIYYGHRGCIALSCPLLQDKPEDLISTLLHEMIHVWCHRVQHRPQEGHGAMFKAKMREINAAQAEVQVTLRHQFDTQALARYQAYCDHCGRSRLYHRRCQGLACGACSQQVGKRWSQQFLLTWIPLH